MRRGWATVVCAMVTLASLAGAGAQASTSGGGTQRWTASYGSGSLAFSLATVVSPDGATVFVTGASAFGPLGRLTTLAYDASSGATRWAADYPGDGSNRWSRGYALAVSPDGSTVFVTGRDECGQCDPQFDGYVTLAYDVGDGSRLWKKNYAAEGTPQSIVVSSDGSKLFVNGSAQLGSGSATVAYDSSSGSQLWAVESSDQPPPLGGALAVSPDGSRVYATGTIQGSGPSCWQSGGVRTVAYDASDGTVRWSSSYNIVANDYCGTATRLAMSSDGSKVFVSGYGGRDGSNTYGAGIVAYDARTGLQLWSREDDGIAVGDGDTTIPLGVSPDGSRLFVLGYDCDRPCTRVPFVTLSYDTASGNQLWESRFDGGGRGWANDLAVSPDGSAIFVTGQEDLPCFDPCTVSQVEAPLVAYDAGTGEERWATSYADNVANDLAVSPDGSSVYMAGSFTASASTARAGARAQVPARSASGSCFSTCGYSTASYNTGPGPGRVQDADHAPRFNGWKTFFHETAVGGAYRASGVSGATARFTTPKVRAVVWLTHAGPDQGKARVFVDGHPQGTFDLYDPVASARSFSFTGLAPRRHTVRVKVLGTKAPSSTGTTVAVDGFEVKVGTGIRQESSRSIGYDSWTGASKAAASGGSYRQSGSPTARLSLAFTGRTVKWITAFGPGFGRARVVIDGTARTVDLYRRSTRWQVPITFSGLARGEHQITVRPLGRKDAASSSTNIVVDAFVVGS